MQWFYWLEIRVLLLLSPSTLFQKINELDWYKEMLHHWVKEQKVKPKRRLLEVGSATGLLSRHLASLGHNVVGVDISKKMVKKAQKGNPNISFFVRDALKLKFKTENFDTILASSLLNVVDDRIAVLKEMLRVCKQSGFVSFLVPIKGFSNKNLELLINTYQLTNFSKEALKAWHKLATKLSMEEIEELVKKSGGKIVSVKYYLNKMVIDVSISKPRF